MKKRLLLGLIVALLLAGCSNIPKLVMTHDQSSDNIKTGSTVNFNVTSDITDDVIEYQWHTSDGTIISSSASSMKWLAPEKPGPAIISIQVSSKELNEPIAITREVQVVSAPKIIAYSMIDSVEVGKETTFSITVEDLDTPANELRYVWFVNGVAVKDAQGTFFKITPSEPSNLIVKVQVEDDLFKDSYQWSLKVVDPDTDLDGLPDSIERLIGTDLNKQDTDGDGLSDYEEIILGTNPLLKDTDGDHIPDGEELQNLTNPLLVDTDYDGIPDNEDVAPYGDAWLKVQINSLELSPINLKENPSQIFFEVYVNGEKKDRIPSQSNKIYEIYAGEDFHLNWKKEYDLPEDKESVEVVIHVIENDFFFNDIIDVNPRGDLRHTSDVLNVRELLDQEPIHKISDGTLDGRKEEDGILDYELQIFQKESNPYILTDGAASSQYILKGNTATIFGFSKEIADSEVVIYLNGINHQMEKHAFVRSNIFVAQIEIDETTPRLITYTVKTKNRVLTEGSIPYPNKETYEEHHAKELEKIRLEEERQQKLASQGALAYIWSQYYVKMHLKSPNSAKFPSQLWTNDVRVSYLGDGRYKVRSYVDSQNSFGAMIRTHYTCELQYSELSSVMILIDLTFD